MDRPHSALDPEAEMRVAGPFDVLRKAVRVLRTFPCEYAVAGGLAANFYRDEPRLTKDVDLILCTTSAETSKDVAVRLAEKLGFHAGLARAADLQRSPGMHKRTTPVVMVIGRIKDDRGGVGLDIILPEMPWVPQALERASANRLDYQFARLATLTPEDFVLSKTFALMDNPSRFRDMDDLAALFRTVTDLDLAYLAVRFERFRLSFPREVEKLAPKALRRLSRSNRSHAHSRR